MNPATRADAQRRADEIRTFNDELARLEADGAKHVGGAAGRTHRELLSVNGW